MTSASRNIVPFPKPKLARVAHEIAFLPAALEIAETPPSPLGRAIGATLIGVFCFALAWAALGTVDIVATANGRIVPSGRSKLIQPLETGVIGAIHVRDGQKVRAGDVLIELDPTMTDAEQERFQSDLTDAQIEVARLRAALAWQDKPDGDPLAQLRLPQGASAAQIETTRQFLASQTSEQKAKLAQVDRELAQKDAERATVAAQIAKLEATAPVLQERVDVRKILYDKQLGSKLVYLTEYQDLVGMKHDIEVQRSRLQEAVAAAAALRESRDRAMSEFRRAIFGDLTRAEQHVADVTQDSVKAERRTRMQRLTAPVDGVVQQLAVHTVGGVVTPAQILAVVVPENSAIEIEATLANRDIGFVHEGQEVGVKVEAFNFTRYGLIRGQVLGVSQDAVTPAQSRASGEAPPGGEKGEGEGPGYVVRIGLRQTEIEAEGKAMKLAPGMAVTAEIRTGSRRIISYLLSPIEKSGQESLRER